VLDASARGGLVCVQSLGARGLAVGAFDVQDAPAFRSRWVRAQGLLPDYADVEAYVEAVLAAIREHSPRVVIPVHDGSVETLRGHRDQIESLTAFALTPNEGLARALDKCATLELAARLGISAPSGVTITPGDDPDARLGELELPLVVKPAYSWLPGLGTRLVSRIVLDREALRRAVDESLASGSAVLLQPWLSGRREAVWLFTAYGHVWARFAQVAHRMYPLLGGSSVLRESIAPPADLIGPAEALVRELGLEGFSEVEFRRDAAGHPFLMEVNPRLSASVELAVRAGMDFPWLLYDWASGARLTPMPDYRVGVRMRWLGGDIRLLGETLAAPPGPHVASKSRALLGFGADCLRPAAYDYVRASDPGPAIFATVDFLRRGLRHGAREVSTRRSPRPITPL